MSKINYLKCSKCYNFIEHGIYDFCFKCGIICPNCRVCTHKIVKMIYSRKIITDDMKKGIPHEEIYQCDDCNSVISHFSTSWNKDDIDYCERCAQQHSHEGFTHYTGYAELTNDEKHLCDDFRIPHISDEEFKRVTGIDTKK